jgi:hypothetical protein
MPAPIGNLLNPGLNATLWDAQHYHASCLAGFGLPPNDLARAANITVGTPAGATVGPIMGVGKLGTCVNWGADTTNRGWRVRVANQPPTNVSWEALIEVGTLPASREPIFGYSGGGDGQYDRLLSITSSGAIEFYWYGGSGYSLTSGSTYVAGQVLHIVVTFGPGAANSFMYINGIQEASGSSLTGFTGYTNPVLVFGYGRTGSGGSLVRPAHKFYFTNVHTRALTIPEMRERASHPFRFVAPIIPVLPVDFGEGPASSDGAGSASGTGTAAGVGASTAAAAGAATGTGTTYGVGASTAASDGAATGTGTATGVGSALFSGVGAATGTGTATGVGLAAFDGAGAATGTSSAAGVGDALFSGAGAATGTGTATGVGVATFDGAGAAAGTGTAAGVGAFTVASDGAAAGTGTAAGVGASDAATTGSAIGTGTASGISGEVTLSGTGTATGTGTAAAVGEALHLAAGAANGTGTAAGTGASTVAFVGAATGTGTALGVGASLASAQGIAAAVGTAMGVGSFSSIFDLYGTTHVLYAGEDTRSLDVLVDVRSVAELGGG